MQDKDFLFNLMKTLLLLTRCYSNLKVKSEIILKAETKQNNFLEWKWYSVDLNHYLNLIKFFLVIVTMCCFDKTATYNLKATNHLVNWMITLQILLLMTNHFKYSCPEAFCKSSVLKNFLKLPGKHPYHSLFI